MSFPIAAYTVTNATGAGIDATRTAIVEGRSGLRRNDFQPSMLDTWIGRCQDVDTFAWSQDEAPWESRNNALAAVGLAQDGFLDAVAKLSDRFGAHRVGVVIGTSTSSIGRTEEGFRALVENRMPPAYRQRRVHTPHSAADFVAMRCGLTGPTMTISTACSSSAKVFATGARWLSLGLADAVLVGGVDSLCLSVLHGFSSLELTSTRPCRPFDGERDGISIGEAAGFALLVADHAIEHTVRLTGYGESSDAYHMSHPHPEGLGAQLAMSAALERAGLEPHQIDYANLHGTASQANDLIETRALAAVFPVPIVASSTKGWTGHTLGAAGIVEALIAADTMVTGIAPGTLNLAAPDPALAFEIQTTNRHGDYQNVLTNSFGFGGNNCSLVFSRCQ